MTNISEPATANYRHKAEEASQYIQSHFYDADAGLYRPVSPAGKEGALAYDFNWGHGVQFTALVGAVKYDPKTYRPILDAFTEGLKRYWDETAPIPGFDAYPSPDGTSDKYYDDNAWFVLGFLDAFNVTKENFYLDWARRTQKFVLSGWDDKLGGGIYWHESHTSKNTCSNAPAAAAALSLYRAGGDKEQLAWAQKIRRWVNSHLQDTDGLFWDNIKMDGTVDPKKYTYNTALMIRADVLLYEVFQDRAYLTDARRMADAGIAHWVDPASGVIQDTPKFAHLFCEALLRLYDATHEARYLNVVRRHATFGYRHARDTDGGYWDAWEALDHPKEERKSLIENAAVARLFWLLAPYPDVDELYAAAMAASTKGTDVKAEGLFRQAAESDNEAVESHFRLWKVLAKEKKPADADAEAAHIREMAKNPTLRARLEAAGWTDAPE